MLNALRWTLVAIAAVAVLAPAPAKAQAPLQVTPLTQPRAPVQAAPQEAATLVIPGANGNQELLRNMALRFMRENPAIKIEVPSVADTTEAVKAVIDGKAALARTNRPLRDAEKAVGITETVFAKAAVVFAIHPTLTGVTNITKEQALGIFSGAITDWSALGGPQGPITPVCLKAPDASRDSIGKVIPGFADTPCQGPNAVASVSEAVQKVEATPGAIGSFPLSAMSTTDLVPLPFDGVLPNAEQLARGTYPLFLTYGLAYKPPLSPAATRLIAFMARPDSRWLLTKFGCLPVTDKPGEK